MGIQVGIDLGTTFCAVARINEETGKPEVIKNSFDSPVTPSVLCFESNGHVLFGEDAKNMQAMGNTNAIAFFKRNMGNENFCVEFFGKSYSATDLTAILIEKLVQEIEASCGEKVDGAVITVPAYFTHKEREATIKAGEMANLKVHAIINEPTAAALAYGLNDKSEEQTVLIYDLGGGTFDVTIAEITKNHIKVLGSDGNHELGGKDWDDCIARYLAQQFHEEYGIDVTEDDEMIASLLVTAETVKKQLTSKDEVIVPITYKGTHGKIVITEELFENISCFLIGSTKDLTDALLSSVGYSWSDITGTVLVGGSTRMRMIHHYVRNMSGKDPLSGINVDEAVALGAAIRANIDESGNSKRQLVVGQIGGKKIGYVLGAKAVKDVTTHALGMIAVSEDGERYMNSIIIPKNTPIPSEYMRSYQFQTMRKDQVLEVYVLQGSHERPLDNIVIDKYSITGIEKTHNNLSIVEVAYKYTSDGTIVIKAFQKETGKDLPIVIEKVPEDLTWTDLSPKDQTESTMMKDVEILLAIDLSGSMRGRPLVQAKIAMKEFIDKMDPDYTKIGLLSFADTTEIVVHPTDEYKKVMRGIDDIDVGDVGIANNGEPFSDALEILYKNRSMKKKDILSYLVVLTDGVWANSSYGVKIAKECHRREIEVMALGFGGADYKFLKQIASSDDFASLTNLSDLGGSFSTIAQVIGDTKSGSEIKAF